MYEALQRQLQEVRNPLNSSQFAKNFRRDLFERYYLVNHIVTSMSDMLNVPIACILLFTAILYIYYASIYIVSGTTTVSTNISWTILSILIFFFATSQLAHANSAIEDLKDKFKYSMPSGKLSEQSSYHNNNNQDQDEEAANLITLYDFEIIGGRDEWLSFLTENPIFWRVFGFPLTSEWLKTLALGAATLILAALVPLVSSLLI